MARLDMSFYSAELDEELVISELPNAQPFQEPSQLHVVDNVIKLTRGKGSSLSSMYVRAIRDAAYQEHADRLGLPKRVCLFNEPISQR